jgi:hypothetical protein
MARGWTHEKRVAVEAAFYKFLGRCRINSKDATGSIVLGENLYDSQKRFITAVFDALENDIHDIYVLKSRQLGLCYAPNMRVLTADLRWVEIDTLKIGDELVAVDENKPGGKGADRKMRTARVEGIREVFEPAYKLTMGNGAVLIATAQHRHLGRKRGGTDMIWRPVSHTSVGDELRYVTTTWGDADYEDGWFGGIIDGEGSLQYESRSGCGVNVAQVAGPVYERIKSYLGKDGYTFREEVDLRKAGESSKFGNKPVFKACVARMDEVFRLIGQTRPSRFVGVRWWEGKSLPGKKSGVGWEKVVSIEAIEPQRMIDIQTSEKTFICEGFVSHNSTISRALTIFLLGVHDGLKGAIVFDTDQNKQESRAELEVMIADLPKTLKFPFIKGNNRAGLTLANDSKVLFMSAGVRKSKTSGTLGRSVGLSLAHCSELCSWDNDDGLEAFKNSLSDTNPDRLYIYESTARGPNTWKTMWEDAKNDPHCCCIFLGWWSKPSQRIDRDDADFLRYGEQPPTDRELEKIALVKKQYDVDITPEQLAWIRRRMDPTAKREGDAPAEYEGDPTRIQEQAWDEKEAFQITGSIFFAPQKLTEQVNRNVSHKFNAYMYVVQDEFIYTKVLKAPNSKMVELKVWEPPVTTGGVYVLGCDTAHGNKPSNDRSSLQIFRCYADGLDQVAEYAWPLITTQHLGYVLASLLGWYGGEGNSIRYILELNGPGGAVYTSLKSLRYQLEHATAQQKREIEERGLQNVFQNVRTYIYNRVDAMGPGFNYHFLTNQSTKFMIMERFRDFVQNGMLHIRSQSLIDEAETVSRDKDSGSIEAPGSMKDDRVVAAALATHCWEDRIKKDMQAQGRTREAEAARQRLSITDQVFLFQQNQLSQFFAEKRSARVSEQRAMIRNSWRGRR